MSMIPALLPRPLRRILSTLFMLLLALSCAGAQEALPVPGRSAPAAAAPAGLPPPPSDITAKSYILLDFASGLALAERDADVEREPASLTKLMTAYMVFQELAEGRMRLDEEVLISERAWRTGMDGASRMFIEVGERVTVEDLLRGMIVQSGNDASAALAERVAGTEGAFVDRMNARARALGMERSHFTNSHGLPSAEAQYTTPRDMATLARALIRDFPEYYRFYSEKSFTYNRINQSNRNLLLWRDESFDGLKTGWTSAAGYNLVSSAQRDGRRLVAVVMGIDAPNHQRGGILRANESQALINWGMRFVDVHRVHEAGTQLAEPRLFKGARTTLPVGVDRAVWIVVPQGRADRLRAELELTEPQLAPVAAGQVVGTLVLRMEDTVVGRHPLVALESVESGGFFRWLWDGAVLSLQSVLPW
jgi:serine-type D-Ala-D-Ala carboxypeptidase (penicillin-binding protein 5/6)